MRASEESEKSRGMWAKMAAFKKQRISLEASVAKVAQEALDAVENHALPHAGDEKAKRILALLRGEYLLTLAELASTTKRRQLGRKFSKSTQCLFSLKFTNR